MKRERSGADDDDDDEDDREETNNDEQRDPKRSRASEKRQEFIGRQREQAFRKVHHPEHVAANLLTEREQAVNAAATFASDLKLGALTGPRLTSAGLLRELPHAESAGGDPPEMRTPPAASHLANFEPLPSTAMSLARAVLCAAGAGPATGGSSSGGADAGMGGDGDDDKDKDGKVAPPQGLVSLMFAEPINHKTRIWAAYASRAAAEAGVRAFRSLPQVAELIDPPNVLRDVLMPCKAVRPPALSDEEVGTHIAKCDAVLHALEARLGLAGQSAAILAADALAALPTAPALSPTEQLELRMLYLRRVHFYDYAGGGPFSSHTSLLSARGESHFPMGVTIHAVREPLAAPLRWDDAEQAADAQLAYLEAIGVVDDKFEEVANAAAEKVYADNCVEEEAGKFRCPLSGKLFKDPSFVRKHIDNKHGAKVLEAKRAALEAKYEEYFLADAERVSAMPSPPPPPPRFERDDRRGSYGDGKGKGKGGGKGLGRGRGYDGGKGFGGDGKGYGRGGGGPPMGPPGERPPPPDGAEVIRRPMVQYKDLDAPDDDDLFS